MKKKKDKDEIDFILFSFLCPETTGTKTFFIRPTLVLTN